MFYDRLSMDHLLMFYDFYTNNSGNGNIETAERFQNAGK